MLVKKYFKGVKDERINDVITVNLDGGTSEENLEMARRYGVTATPVLIVTDAEGNKLEEYVGGLKITQNIRTILANHG